MADVISIDKRRQLSEREKREIIRKRKVLAVRKIFQCARCTFKCDKCGTQISNAQLQKDGQPPKPGSPYRFCESCMDEYRDYIARAKDGGDSDYYWHNDAWAAEWRLWIDHQKAVDRYLKSREFKRLLNEIRQTHPDA
ncbi:MAG: hypothetical protein DSY89_09450 [Deltaproteobacteria bacterium]|nr:MAG: hypothetical protein DSY89_09450 [Deltaproteobacteria bacterium]